MPASKVLAASATAKAKRERAREREKKRERSCNVPEGCLVVSGIASAKAGQGAELSHWAVDPIRSGRRGRRLEAEAEQLQERFVGLASASLIALEVLGDAQAVEHGQ